MLDAIGSPPGLFMLAVVAVFVAWELTAVVRIQRQAHRQREARDAQSHPWR